jgi:hypothetical protein
LLLAGVHLLSFDGSKNRGVNKNCFAAIKELGIFELSRSHAADDIGYYWSLPAKAAAVRCDTKMLSRFPTQRCCHEFPHNLCLTRPYETIPCSPDWR